MLDVRSMEPIYVPDAAEQERKKYNEVWQHPNYGKCSPGLDSVVRFFNVVDPLPGSSIVDLGAGSCLAGLEMAKQGMDVWYTDLTDIAVPPEVDRQRFIQAPLWGNWRPKRYGPWEYGFCCDVLEHIPPEFTMLCVDKILTNCRVAWLQICLVPDNFGKDFGEPLHLTVQPFRWWLTRLSMLGKVVDARDLIVCGIYTVTR